MPSERIESIVQQYLSGKVTQLEAINSIKREHWLMSVTHEACLFALTDIGMPINHATSLVHAWEQELNETVQLA